MKTTDDFARAALQISDLANRMLPPEGAPYANTRTLVIFYLRMAAKHAREIAEAIANVGQESKP